MTTTERQYPGLGLPLRQWPSSRQEVTDLTSYPIGHYPRAPGSESVLLPVREVAMMAVMDRLTDKPDWQRKVFDEEIVGKWKAEALAIPNRHWMDIASNWGHDWDLEGWEIFNGLAFDYCVQELRSKARYYEKTQLVPTLDACAAVVKSDVLVTDEVQHGLRKAFQRLQKDQEGDPDWHPKSGELVQDLVHPALYPLVYGHSKVFKDEVVGVSDAIHKWAGKGEIIPQIKEEAKSDRGYWEIASSYWSDNYQLLPSNVAFQDNGKVKITSYINNLHPVKYPEIYTAVENLIEMAIPAWDQCLLTCRGFELEGPGRNGSRFALPDAPDDEVQENWNPSDPNVMADADIDLDELEGYYSDEFDDSGDESEVEVKRREHQAYHKWKVLRKPAFKGPGPYSEVDYNPYATPQGAEKPDGGLFRKFKESGLQVIVKMSSIELTPEKPKYTSGSWHVEGLLNEKICATALYYLDNENITDSSLAFRMQTDEEQQELRRKVWQDSFYWLQMFYGTRLRDGPGSCVQNYGAVNTPEGRLLAFPNVFEHRVSPFELKDPSKPGHRRFIALFLVDPHRRILSTANVPPQQQDWWLESSFGTSAGDHELAAEKLPAEFLQLLIENDVPLGGEKPSEKTRTLPTEVLDMVRDEFSLPGMSWEEAKEHRVRFMGERTKKQVKVLDSESIGAYNFCEH